MSENAMAEPVVVGSAGTLAVPSHSNWCPCWTPEVFDQWKVRIGSGPGNDWVLKDNTVSATAEITVTDKAFASKTPEAPMDLHRWHSCHGRHLGPRKKSIFRPF